MVPPVSGRGRTRASRRRAPALASGRRENSCSSSRHTNGKSAQPKEPDLVLAMARLSIGSRGNSPARVSDTTVKFTSGTDTAGKSAETGTEMRRRMTLASQRRSDQIASRRGFHHDSPKIIRRATSRVKEGENGSKSPSIRKTGCCHVAKVGQQLRKDREMRKVY